MTKRVTLIDYGIGNLLSVRRAFEACGAEVVQTENPAEIVSADYLVLPGVGAFADGMRQLHNRKMVEPIRAACASGKPVLGICLGMQMMFAKTVTPANAGAGNYSGAGRSNSQGGCKRYREENTAHRMEQSSCPRWVPLHGVRGYLQILVIIRRDILFTLLLAYL